MNDTQNPQNTDQNDTEGNRARSFSDVEIKSDVTPMSPTPAAPSTTDDTEGNGFHGK